MKKNISYSQKIGWIVFGIGVIYMLGLGWLYSWRMVPAANQSGAEAIAGLLGLVWGLSVPAGAFVVVIGAALIARVERLTFLLLILIVLITVAWRVLGTTSQFIPALFGIGGGLITLFFLGSAWNWARVRSTLSRAARTGSDLRMLGAVFFVLAAWDLCSIFGIGSFVLMPELADKFAVPLGSTINSASGVLILLVLGWGFNFFGQLVSRRVQVADHEAEKAPHIAEAARKIA